MNLTEQQEQYVQSLRKRIDQLEVTPEQILQSREIKRNSGLNAELGGIALAGSILESSYSLIKSSREQLANIFKKHGTPVSPERYRTYEILLPDDQYLLVQATKENLAVEISNWTFHDTELRQFPANKLRYTDGGTFGHYEEATLYVGGLSDTWVEIKADHRLSLRRLPEGVSLEEFLGPTPQD